MLFLPWCPQFSDGSLDTVCSHNRSYPQGSYGSDQGMAITAAETVGAEVVLADSMGGRVGVRLLS